MQGAIKVFSGRGDTTVLEYDTEVPETIEKARGVFDQAKSEGYAAVMPSPIAGEGAIAMDHFEPVGEVVLLRPIAGG